MLCTLLKKNSSNETAFFNKFDKLYWSGTHDCWLISELGPRSPRTNNALDLYNGHDKRSFTENHLLPATANESLGGGQWVSALRECTA